MLARTLLLLTILAAPGLARAADTTPFFRIGEPNLFEVGTVAQQYTIQKPREATSYRFVNRCNVDVRIRKVGGLEEQVTRDNGTLYLARSVETVATSNPQFVSLIAMDDPGEKGCRVELQYGTGN